MRRARAVARSSFLFALALLTVTGAARAQDKEERELGFKDTADLAYVLTAGNSSSSTLGLKNVAQYYWTRSSLKFDVGGIKTTSGTITRTATLQPGGSIQVEDRTYSETTAENYFAVLRYDFFFTEKWFGFTSGGWTRDQFAGTQNKWTGVLGAGSEVIGNDNTTLKLDAGVTYTSEELVVGPTSNYGGLRFGWDFKQKVTESTDFTSVMVLDENLKDTEDLRADFLNELAVSINSQLALKAGLRLQWRNQPALTEVDVTLPDGTPTGVTVDVPLKKLDTTFTTALVIKM